MISHHHRRHHHYHHHHHPTFGEEEEDAVDQNFPGCRESSKNVLISRSCASSSNYEEGEDGGDC